MELVVDGIKCGDDKVKIEMSLFQQMKECSLFSICFYMMSDFVVVLVCMWLEIINLRYKIQLFELFQIDWLLNIFLGLVICKLIQICIV